MRTSQKISYEVDPSNRLVRRGLSVPKFRQVLDGRFRVAKNNVLTYHVKSPPASPCPRQLKLSGNWSLDKEHNLVLTLDKGNNQRPGDKLTLKGEIIDGKADKLEFCISTKDVKGRMQLYILRLEGRWQTDRHNRLSFLAQKAQGLNDELILAAGWEVDKQNRLVYTYIRTALKTKKKINRTLTFKGFWDITAKNRVSYILNKNLNSGFDFQVSLGRPTKYGLLYEVGIGVKPAKKRITLLGSWKINEKLGLLFEMPYEGGELRSIVLEADCTLDKGYNLNLRLKSALHQDLGITLKLSKTLFKKQGQVFLEALKQGKEITFVAGLGFRW